MHTFVIVASCPCRCVTKDSYARRRIAAAGQPHLRFRNAPLFVHVTNMSNVQQKLEDEITCPVCQDTFDKPKILPCGHYYCKRCVLQLAAREQPFPCPECRRDTHLPPGPTGVDEFPTAFFVNRMKSLHDDLDHVESPDLKVKSRVTSSLYDNASPLLAARAEKNTTRADQQSYVKYACVYVHSLYTYIAYSRTYTRSLAR